VEKNQAKQIRSRRRRRRRFSRYRWSAAVARRRRYRSYRCTPYRNRARDSLTQIARVPNTHKHKFI